LIIGHITDAHIGAAWLYSQRLPSVLTAISQQAQIMVDTGDCTENGTEAETIEYVQLVSGSTTIPWRAVPGNHDTPWVFERYVGPLQWSWDVGSYRLIGVNSESVDYTTLDEALTSDKTCIVLGHFPLSWYDPQDQQRLRQRFKTYHVPIYIAGHTHLDSIETDPESGTVLLTGQRAGLGHYRLITLRGWTVEDITFESTY
jgi:predicted phosphodiesterase